MPEKLYWEPGDPTPRGVVGFDTETTLIDRRPGAPPPTLVLASWCDGRDAGLVRADDVPRWLEALDDDALLVAHNAVFDYEVVAAVAGPAWERRLDRGGLRCTLLLDQLVRLGEGNLPSRGVFDEVLPPRSLARCAEEYLGVQVEKGVVRLGFGRLLEAGYDALTSQERRYALDDARTVRALYHVLDRRARLVCAALPRGRLFPGFAAWGPLTVDIQLRGAVSLAAIGRRGIGVDVAAVRRIRERFVEEKDRAAEVLREAGCLVPELRLRNPPPDAQWIGGRWVRRWKLDVRRTGEALLADTGVRFPPKTPNGKISLAAADWKPFGGELVRAFVTYRRSEKYISTFLRRYTKERVWPRYVPLVRSGRTSCRAPNLQQVPRRRDSLREVFVPGEGRCFVEVDYRAIELSAVAEVCLGMFGRSVLAEKLNAGEDPHAAFQRRAAEAGLEIDRTTAKMANFGFAGGMGARTFERHLLEMAGVRVGEQEARALRLAWLATYPEFREYLREWDAPPRVPGLTPSALRWAIADVDDPRHGRACAALGLEAGVAHDYRVWDAVLRRVAAVPTGRVRGGPVGYCVQRNTPFQGLAADGAKLGLWELHRCGGGVGSVVAFVHDSVLVEVPRADFEGCARRVGELLLRGMQRVVRRVAVGVELCGPMRSWGDLEAPTWEMRVEPRGLGV